MRRAFPIGLALLVVVAVGALLARWLALEGAERAAVLERLERDAGTRVEVLRLDSATAYSLGDERGPTRVAFRLRGTTVVRCADVERRGSVLSGREVIVHGLSAPIGLQQPC